MKLGKNLLSLLCSFSLMLSAGVLPVFSDGQTTAQEPLIKVACVGDSITAGNKSSKNETCSYPAQLQTILDNSMYEVKNFGHSGAAALRDVTARTPYRTTAAYRNSLEYLPDVVIIMLGTNDVVCSLRFNEENYYTDLGDLVKEYQDLSSHPTVYLCTPLTAFDANHPTPLQEVAVPTVKRIAEDTGAILVDINAASADYMELGYIADQIHPNDAGYLALAQLFAKEVFDKEIYRLTVLAKTGLTAWVGGQKVAINDSGFANLVVGEGTKTLRLSNVSGGFAEFPLSVSGNLTADCSALNLPDNLARAAETLPLATVLREGETYRPAFAPTNAFDGNETTGWQLDTPYGYDYGIYVGCDFTVKRSINTVELALEQGSFPGGLVTEYSEDGTAWVAVPDATVVLANGAGRITFPDLETQYIRVRFTSGTTMYRPKVWEMRVFNNTGDSFTPIITQGNHEPARPLKVACIGDSITEGIGSSGLMTNSYPAQLQTLLDSSRYQVGKFGTSGRTAIKESNSDVYVPYWNDANFTKSKNFLPDIVIIMLGTNDVMCDTWSPQAYYEGIKGLIQTYQDLSSSPTVWVCTPMHAFDEKHPDKLAEGIPLLKQAVSETGANLLDVNTLTADYFEKGYINGGNDLIHPNDAGYLAFATLIFEEIFGGTTTTLTVKAQPGLKVTLGGQKKTVPTSGLVEFVAGSTGTKKVIVDEVGIGSAEVQVPMNGRTTADFTGLTIAGNLAFEADVLCSTTEKLKDRINDGDLTHGWQEQEDGAYTNNWIGYDFGEAKEFDRVNLYWEGNTRAPEGGYVIQISDNGTDWRGISDSVYEIGEKDDIVTFPLLSARYVRLKITAGTDNKYRPHIFEMQVLRSNGTFNPTVTYEEEPGDLTGDGQVTAADLTALARHLGQIALLDDKYLSSADADGNDLVEAADLTVLARQIAGISSM